MNIFTATNKQTSDFEGCEDNNKCTVTNEEIVQDLKDTYENGDDTWMEGDIYITDNAEL